jgi:hypothetical protein
MEEYKIDEDPLDKIFGLGEKKEPKKVFLHVTRKQKIYNAHGLYKDCDDCKISSDEECTKCSNNWHPTLRDISIIMYEMVGQGVKWQLAGELANRLGLNPYDITTAIGEIIKEYSQLSEQEALNRFYDAPKLPYNFEKTPKPPTPKPGGVC